MKLNEKKFFELAKENGFEAADLNYNQSHSLSIEVFHGEVSSFSQNDGAVLSARGIINGKFGGVVTEIIDKNTPEYLINGIKKTASVIQSDNPSIIFKGSKKYHKKNLYNKDLLGKPTKEKIELLLEIEKKLFAYDKRIVEVAAVGYSETGSFNQLSNSYGLKLKQQSCYYDFYAEVTAKEGDEIRTGYSVFASDKFDEFDIDKFVEKVAKDALNKLGSKQCASKKYPVVLNPKSASLLTMYYLQSADAEEVQKHSSLFVDKLHKQVASKKFSVIENPLLENIMFRYFDDEGVATSKKFIIKKGVLETYLYTLETAQKDNVEPTGNGYRGSGRAHADIVNAIIKPGKKSEEQLFSEIKEGVYITNLEGLHAGMNAKSGNFSLQSEGFMIRDGKLAEPLSLITLAGNLTDLFMNVKDVANNSEFNLSSGITSPSIRIKKLAVSGK